MRKHATILMIDSRGWVLLQERDEHAPIAPDQWGMVGGEVEEGETFEQAAYRELEEETGVRLCGGLSLWTDALFQYDDSPTPNRYQIWTTTTDLTDDDISVREGRRIVFVDPREVPKLDLSQSAAFFVSKFLNSGHIAADV